MQRLRVQYAKRGRLRFTSHRDFSRAFERAVFRARVPMAYSSGFNPHPRISYAGAAPTGAASEAEYLELGARRGGRARRDVTPRSARRCRTVSTWWRSWSRRGRGSPSCWRPATGGSSCAAPAADIGPAVEAFLAADRGAGRADDQEGAAAVRLPRAGAVAGGCPTRDGLGVLDLVLRHAEPAVRPDDVLAGIGAVSGLELGGVPLLTRLAQGPLDPATGDDRRPAPGLTPALRTSRVPAGCGSVCDTRRGRLPGLHHRPSSRPDDVLAGPDLVSARHSGSMSSPDRDAARQVGDSDRQGGRRPR